MRKRDPQRLERVLQAAAEVFTTTGFAQSKIHLIAERAKVSPGTVYLYAEDKEALFELVVLRVCENPAVARIALPYRKATPAGLASLVWKSVEAIAHFPQLWLAGQRRQIPESNEEYHGILLELANWMSRYRAALLIAYRNRKEWPLLADAFDRLVWKDLQHRLSAFFGERMRTGHLPAAGDPVLAARHTIDALAGTLVGNPVYPEPIEAPEIASAVVEWLVAPGSTRAARLER